MYAMMAGRSPFAGKKLTQVIEALKRDRAVPLELINPDIPHEVVEIVHHLLEKDPNKRPPTALSVSKRLKATRAGLQRERTVTLENELTASGTQERDFSLKDIDTQHSHLTDLSRLQNPGAATDAGSDREKTDPNQPSLHRGSATKGSAVHSVDNSDMVTAATDGPVSHKSMRSDASIHSLDFETESPLVAPTTFKTVEPNEADQGFFGRQATATTAHHWLQIASIAGMLAILAGGVYLFVRAAQTPSADVMFATLQTAEQEGELTLHESLLERFLVYYPDNENAEQVQRWQQQAELERTMKRLVSRAQRIGGISKLDPAAQGFYHAMQLRDSSNTEAENHLRAWLDVFAVDESVAKPAVIEPVSMSQLTRLARQELQRLQSNDAVTLETDSRVERLHERITASEEMDRETRVNLLRGLIRLYGKDAWARPAVDRAAAMLAVPANPEPEDAK
jgi:serine/threonine-protein kinase